MLGSAELPITILAWFLVLSIVLVVIASIGVLLARELEIRRINESQKSTPTKVDLRA